MTTVHKSLDDNHDAPEGLDIDHRAPNGPWSRPSGDEHLSHVLGEDEHIGHVLGESEPLRHVLGNGHQPASARGGAAAYCPPQKSVCKGTIYQDTYR